MASGEWRGGDDDDDGDKDDNVDDDDDDGEDTPVTDSSRKYFRHLTLSCYSLPCHPVIFGYHPLLLTHQPVVIYTLTSTHPINIPYLCTVPLSPVTILCYSLTHRRVAHSLVLFVHRQDSSSYQHFLTFFFCSR